MSHVAVLGYPSFGHLSPTLAVTRSLVARGHRVTYLVDAGYADAVAGAGARAVTYRARRADHGGDLGKIGLDFLRDSIDVVLPTARTQLAADVPDLLLYDYESCVSARTLAGEWERPTVQFFPYFASNETYSVYAELFGPDDPALHQSMAILRDFLGDGDIGSDRFWALMAPCDRRNVAFIPKEIQPSAETFDERFAFVGPPVPSCSDSREWPQPAVLVSAGSVTNDRADFFATCAEAFEDKHWHVVMTGAPARQAPPNVETHQWLPHPVVLPHVAALVCHGGMSTVAEALAFGRPVVIVPYLPEQRINGRRIDELGLGRLLPQEELTAARLRATVEELATDPPTLARLARLRAAIAAAGGASRAADVVEELL